MKFSKFKEELLGHFVGMIILDKDGVCKNMCYFLVGISIWEIAVLPYFKGNFMGNKQ